MYSLRFGFLSSWVIYPKRSWDVHFNDRIFQLQSDISEYVQVINRATEEIQETDVVHYLIIEMLLGTREQGIFTDISGSAALLGTELLSGSASIRQLKSLRQTEELEDSVTELAFRNPRLLVDEQIMQARGWISTADRIAAWKPAIWSQQLKREPQFWHRVNMEKVGLAKIW